MSKYCQYDDCTNEIINPTKSSKWCSSCAVLIQREKVSEHYHQEQRELKKQKKERRKEIIRNLCSQAGSILDVDVEQIKKELNTPKINPFFLKRGKQSNIGERVYVN